MRKMTVLVGFFLPLTLITGVFGMRFAPEVSPWDVPIFGWMWSFPAALLLLAGMGFGLLKLYRTIGWLGPLHLKKTLGRLRKRALS